MVAVAVQLDGEAVLGPAAVDAFGAGGAVGDGEGEVVFFEEREEALLELAEGDGDVAAQDGAQVLGALGCGVSGEDGVDVSWCGVVFDAGLVSGSGEGIEGEACGDVDEDPRDGGDRDAAVGGGVSVADLG